LLLLLRDCADTPEEWGVVLEFVRNLPDKFAAEPQIQENRAFAAAQAGNDVQAIAELETLIQMLGPTAERLGLIGGRYKRIAKAAASDAERRQAIAKAIDYYERGM